jgi:hypothetical protein
MNWVIAVSAVGLLGTAVVTLRAAEQTATSAKRGSTEMTPAVSTGSGPAGVNAAGTRASPVTSLGSGRDGPTSTLDSAGKQHPPASAPEESATIADDPTTAPDPSQSADNNVSFPTDI